MHPEIPAERSSRGSQCTARCTEDGKKPPKSAKKLSGTVDKTLCNDPKPVKTQDHHPCCPCNPRVFSSGGSGFQHWREPQVSVGGAGRGSSPCSSQASSQPCNALFRHSRAHTPKPVAHEPPEPVMVPVCSFSDTLDPNSHSCDIHPSTCSSEQLQMMLPALSSMCALPLGFLGLVWGFFPLFLLT